MKFGFVEKVRLSDAALLTTPAVNQNKTVSYSMAYESLGFAISCYLTSCKDAKSRLYA